MSRKKKVEETPTSLESELMRLIDKVLKDRESAISIIEVKQIVRELIPDIDRIIANKMKQHFYELGSFLVEKFKLEE